MTAPVLEDVYAALAEAIDAVGREKEALFLAKVALLLAADAPDKAVVLRWIEAARTDLDGMRPPAE